MLKCQCGLYNHDAKVAFETEVSIEVDSGYFLKIKLLIVGIISLCVFTVGRVIYPTWIPFQRYHRHSVCSQYTITDYSMDTYT